MTVQPNGIVDVIVMVQFDWLVGALRGLVMLGCSTGAVRWVPGGVRRVCGPGMVLEGGLGGMWGPSCVGAGEAVVRRVRVRRRRRLASMVVVVLVQWFRGLCVRWSRCVVAR